MAREARVKSKSGNYFISLKGEELFVTENDKSRFMEIVTEKFEGGKVYGVEIEKEEIRMVVKESEKGISMIMKSLQTVYARYFNNANEREGKLFLGRFQSLPLESKKEVDQWLADLKVKSQKPKTAKAPSKKKTVTKKKAVESEKTEPERTVSKKTEKQAREKAAPAKPKKKLPSWLL